MTENNRNTDFDDGVVEQASRWVIRVEDGLDAEQKRAFKAWLQANAAHQDAFIEMATMWGEMDALARLKSLFPEPVGMAGLSAAEQVDRPVASARRRMGYPGAPAWLSPSLAVGLVVITLAIVLNFGEGWLFRAKPEALMVQTVVGEHKSVTLADGSTLFLNTNSRVSVALHQSRRSLVLEQGELHIEVAHDPTRPLSVTVGEQVVEAVGTAFNIQLLNDQRMQLLVTEGEVRVAGATPAQNVSAGQQLIAAVSTVESGTISELADYDPAYIEAKLSWREGNLVFQGESLAEAIKEISRYTQLELVLEDQALVDMPVIGLFKAGDIEGLLRTLQQNFNLEYQREGSRVVFTQAD